MHTIGDESSMAVAIPVTMLVAPGPEVATATPPCPLERVVGRKNGSSGISEDDLHTLTLEAFPENASPGHVLSRCLVHTALPRAPKKQNPPGQRFWRGGIDR